MDEKRVQPTSCNVSDKGDPAVKEEPTTVPTNPTTDMIKNEKAEPGDSSSEELNEARKDSGIDYEGDEVVTGDEDDEDVNDDEINKQNEVKLTEEEEKQRQKLREEEEKEYIERQKKQKETLNALRESAAEEFKNQSAETRRMEFLMAQSDVFTSFLMGGTSMAGKMLTKQTKETGVASPNRRGRKKDDTADNKALLEMEESRFTRLEKQPNNIKFGTMRPFQLEGLNWMIRLHDCNVNGILADEMGLGKTLQTISLLAYLREARGIDGPHIIIVPKSTVGNWMKELHRWCPSIRAFRFMGNKEERARLREAHPAGSFDACVLSYEMTIIEKAWLRKFKWKYLVIDEAHRIKNENSKLSLVVREFNVEHRLLITGTPLQNNLHELWALLNFLLPDIFGDSEEFDAWFNIEGENAQQNVIKKLHTILRPFLLRRLKVDVAHGLPPKTETKLFVGLSDMQREWYTRVLQKDATHLNAIGGSDRVRLLNILMQLRKVCNHPYLFEGAEPQPFVDGAHLWENCGKMTLLTKLLPKLKEQGSRVLLFCQMTRMLDILEDFLRYFHYDYCRIDGQTKGEDRDAFMDEFNAPNSSKFCFLLSTRAGGLGINLATADIVILYDSDWNPQVDLQAMDRAHRIGQKKPVRVFRLISEGTVEEKIIERAERKLYLDAAVIQQGRLAEQNRKLSKDELMSMVRFGADEIFNAKGSMITEDDIDAILARGEERTDQMKKKINEDMQHNLRNFTLSGDTSNLYEFEGETFAAKEDTGNILPASFIALPQRERKKNYDVDEYYRKQSGTKAKSKNREPRQPKAPVLHDFQFFDYDRLYKLLQKRVDLECKLKEHMKLIREAKAEELKEKKRKEKEAAEAAASEMATKTEDDSKEDKPLESELLEKELGRFDLPKRDQEEIEKLEKEGFGDFSRNAFKQFVASCERFGRDAKDEICTEVANWTGKELSRVQEYYKVFWKRCKELKDYNRIIERIERGEKRIERHLSVTNALSEKCARYRDPWRDMVIQYTNASKMKGYTHEEDVFLVCLMNKYGYGSDWSVIKDEIRKAWQFRFDWFFKSRDVNELQKRGEYLTRIIERENAEIHAAEKEEENALRNKVKRKKAAAAKEASKKSGSKTTSTKRPAASSKAKSSTKRQRKR